MSVTGELHPPYTLEQLVHVFRQNMDDLPGDIVDTDTPWDNNDDGLLWKNSEIVRYANAAQRQLYERVNFYDSTTVALTQITVVADLAVYTYDARILGIRRVKFVDSAGDEWPLTKAMQENMDMDFPRWDSAASGTVDYYIEDEDERTIRLYRPPELNGTLYLNTWRLPLETLQWKLKHIAIETAVENQDKLFDYMAHLAYLKKDAETERPELAKEHLALFTHNVGDLPSAHLQALRRKESRAHRRVRANYF